MYSSEDFLPGDTELILIWTYWIIKMKWKLFIFTAPKCVLVSGGQAVRFIYFTLSNQLHSVTTLLPVGTYVIFFKDWHVVCSEMLVCIPLLYCRLPVSLNSSGPSPLTSLINNVFPTQNCHSLDVLCCLFFCTIICKLETAVCQNPSSFWDIQSHCLASTIISCSKSLRSHFFPILMFGLNNK